MRPERLRRLLELVERELGADDARLELGGREPQDERFLWCPIGEDWRLVASFKIAPPERARLLARLRQLAAAFSDIPSSGNEPPGLREPLMHRLDSELEALAERIEATHALVIDETSPVIWGISEPRFEAHSVESALETTKLAKRLALAELDLAEALCAKPELMRQELLAKGFSSADVDALSRKIDHIHADAPYDDVAAWRRHLLVDRAIALVREQTAANDYVSGHLRASVREPSFGYLARSFATIYQLIVVFDHDFSELHAEGAVVHILPLIERLVLALPPVDPTPGRARIVKFPGT
jgi:hypothetical protein